MDYEELLSFATAMGHRLQESGAEIYRVEESVQRVLSAYGVSTGEVFAIPNCLFASVTTPGGTHPITRVRRMGFHGTDVYRLELLNDLSRKICATTPPLEEAWDMLRDICDDSTNYSYEFQLFAHALAGFAFAFFFGGGFRDAVCAALCGLSIGVSLSFLSKFNTNPFFKTGVSGFFSAVVALLLTAAEIGVNYNIIIIAALMDLVPGIAFTTAVRDIIMGDTFSGMSRALEAILIGVSIALGTGLALVIVSAMGVPL